ncbi:hypothetical protein ACSN29_004897, partial [Salmonella enterica]
GGGLKNVLTGHRVSGIDNSYEMRLRIPLSPPAGSIKHTKRGVDSAKHWFLARQVSIISRNYFPLEHFLSRR